MAKATKKTTQKAPAHPKQEKAPKITLPEHAQVFALYHGVKVFRHAGWNPQAECLSAPPTAFINQWVLQLTPLEAITDEHIMEVLRLNLPERNLDMISVRERDMLLLDFRGQLGDHNRQKLGYRSWVMLVRRGYAVPLFFDLNHWANGKTALDLGLATEPPAPETAVDKPKKAAKGTKKTSKVPAKKEAKPAKTRAGR